MIHGSKSWEKKIKHLPSKFAQIRCFCHLGESPTSQPTQLLRISNYPGGCGCFWARNGYFEHIDLRLRLDFGSQVFSNMYWEFLIFVALDLFLLSHVCWLIWKKIGENNINQTTLKLNYNSHDMIFYNGKVHSTFSSRILKGGVVILLVFPNVP